MHVPPAARRWAIRAGLAIAVAVAIAVAPTVLDKGDGRADRLRSQLRATQERIRELDHANRVLLDDIAALRDDVGAIERRARDELGMVYPGELVLRLESP